MKKLLVFLFLVASLISKSQSLSEKAVDSIMGTWVIDLRPTPGSEPYLKEFKITKITGKEFEGEFYGTVFTGGIFNTDWGKIYFAFSTADQNNTYFHSGYIEGNKIQALSYCEARKFSLPWKGEKKM